MKQLLIVNSAKALKTGNADDLTVLEAGQLGFFNVKTADDGHVKFINAKPTENFGIALGKGANMPAFVIPEVDVNTLGVTAAAPKAGAKFKITFTVPTPLVGAHYTVILVKTGVVTHERNLFTTTVQAKTATAADVANAIKKDLQAKIDAGMLPMTVSVASAAVTIEALEFGDQWTYKLADGLVDVTPSVDVKAEPNIGDTAYIKHLAQQCAAGKGFNLLDQESLDIYPGYPEAVEEIAQDDIATKGYTLFSLRFATKRDSGKQVDERVWQYVHIAVPTNNTSLNTIKAVLGQPVLVNEPANP